MANAAIAVNLTQDLIGRINGMHRVVERIAVEQSATELCQSFGPTAPPIAWHIWHLIRWADRVQATLPNGTDHPDPDYGIWQQQRLAVQWGLNPTKLGLFESGVSMAFADAQTLCEQMEQAALVDYAAAVVERTTGLLNTLTVEEMGMVRLSPRNFRINNGAALLLPNHEAEVFPDLTFLLAHGSRHLGMIEALRGLLQRAGSASI
ncbi:MAG: hypothetical protein KDE47_11050 [Caldilineaceae bacterium]|nr:hypothetical protein [Caldilineaceae bacterium]